MLWVLSLGVSHLAGIVGSRAVQRIADPSRTASHLCRYTCDVCFTSITSMMLLVVIHATSFTPPPDVWFFETCLVVILQQLWIPYVCATYAFGAGIVAPLLAIIINACFLSQIGKILNLPPLVFTVSAAFGRVSILGVTLVAIVTGWMSIHHPLTVFFSNLASVDTETVETVKLHLHAARATLYDASRSAWEKTSRSDAGVEYLESGKVNLDRRRSSGHSADPQALEMVVRDLETLVSEFGDASSRQPQTNTEVLLAWGMAAVCLYRITASAFNVLFRRPDGNDLITSVLDLILERTDLSFDIDSGASLLSSLLMGALLIFNLRSFTQYVRLVSARNGFLSPSALLLGISFFGVLYFPASTLLMHIYIPQNRKYHLASSIPELGTYSLHFDFLYILSVIFGTVFFGLRYSYRKAKLKYP